ncbi:bacillithiol biosynthesis deacetylase BshB2, partial [Staphylococcus aureus]|nr:bacillithiol biosynthesis deacetylase BshB2 [Staphylococcus aureus]
MSEESQVLVIFPHPDDESFSSAGTLARYIDNG